MLQKNMPCTDSLIPREPMPAGSSTLHQRMSHFMVGKPNDEAAVSGVLDGMDAWLDVVAASMYNLASMLVGEGEESIELIEQAIATAEVSICHEPEQARKNGRLALCRAALQRLARRDPEALAAPLNVGHAVTCLDGDDLESSGLRSEDLNRIFAGPARGRVRSWLESLPTRTRTVFVLRAVGGICNVNTAKLLNEAGGEKNTAWTPEAVSEIFRQGLCSLASQLMQASVTR